ncbi:MAG TPA: hypothetical protein VGG99_20230 [Acetobacteraceae bacterium]
MLLRLDLVAMLLLLEVAAAKPALNVTQIGSGAAPDGPTYKGNCVKDACWATLPVQVSGDRCVLNLRAGVPGKGAWGKILFAVGPCRSGENWQFRGAPHWRPTTWTNLALPASVSLFLSSLGSRNLIRIA